MAERARHIDEWHEDHGDVLWWHPGEPPYVGSPLDCGFPMVITFSDGQEITKTIGGWPNYHEWWTPLPPVPVFSLNEGSHDNA